MANMDKSGDRLKAGAQLLNSKLLALANWQRQLTVFTIEKKNHSVRLVHFSVLSAGALPARGSSAAAVLLIAAGQRNE